MIRQSMAIQLLRFLGLAALVVLLGHMNLEIPGAHGVKSNFAEVALLLSIPLLPRWYLALLLSCFTFFNVTPDGSALPETINHMISLPVVWVLFQKTRAIQSAYHYAGLWLAILFAYYFVGLIPLIYLAHVLFGNLSLQEVPNSVLSVSKMVVYEFVVTASITLLNFLMLRELSIRRRTQEDLRKTNAEILQQKSLLQAQYDITKEGILVISPTGAISSWNNRLLEIWQISPQESACNLLLSLPPVAFSRQSDSDPTSPTIPAHPTGSEPESTQDTLQLEDGRTIERFTAPIHGQQGEFFGRVWFFRDISDLEAAQAEKSKLQQQLVLSQKMEALGQLAGGMAHDFNNSLSAIMGAADLALFDKTPPSEQREYLRMILGAARRASDLTKKLLRFSRKRAKSMAQVDVATVAQDTIELLRRTFDKKITLRLENTATHSLVLGDEGLLQSVLMNLGINASQAMPLGGSLSFRLENQILTEAFRETSPFEIEPGPHLVVSVEDTGIGMAPETLERIFEPLFTTKKEGEGTGLGLSVVRNTIAEHRGAITVQSELDRGTEFRIFLPLASISELASENNQEPCAAGTGTILVVDDDESIRNNAKAMLTGFGYHVVLATDGRICVETLGRMRGRVDLVLLDMMMPDMDGSEALSMIRVLDSSLPVVLTSGSSEQEELVPLGAQGFLQKPYDRVTLARTLDLALRKHRRNSHPR